jgi:hypothetical protein
VSTETITWHPVSEPPDADTTVLVFIPAANDPVWLGLLDGDTWREVNSAPISPTHWAEIPRGPGS